MIYIYKNTMQNNLRFIVKLVSFRWFSRGWQLEKARNCSKTIFNTLDVGVWFWKRDGTLERVNIVCRSYFFSADFLLFFFYFILFCFVMFWQIYAVLSVTVFCTSWPPSCDNKKRKQFALAHLNQCNWVVQMKKGADVWQSHLIGTACFWFAIEASSWWSATFLPILVALTIARLMATVSVFAVAWLAWWSSELAWTTLPVLATILSTIVSIAVAFIHIAYKIRGKKPSHY